MYYVLGIKLYMRIRKIFIICFLTVFSTVTSAQVKIRLFSNQSPESAVFSVTHGQYEVNCFNGEPLIVKTGEPVVIYRFDGKLAVKARSSKGFICDSVIFSGQTGDDNFSLMINIDNPVRQYYSGDLQCFPDMGALVLINLCDIKKYISGVVITEGGIGRNIEYFKTQAVIARTYMYKYFDKHQADRYNVCDNTHCQAFNGMSSDSIKLVGRGYGHGVGLCQEGAMVMADKGFNYKQIIDFYYTGVVISDIKNVVILPPDN